MSEREIFHHYLPVDEAAIARGIYTTGAGRATVQPGQSYPPTGHPGPYDFCWRWGRTLPEFQVLLVTEGHGSFESRETGPRSVGNGTTMFLFPGVWHRYQPDPATGWTERWMSFNGEFAHRWMDRGPIGPDSAIRSAADPNRPQAEFDRLLGNLAANPAQNSLLLSLRAMSLLATVLEASAPEELTQGTGRNVDVHDPVVAQAIEYIWTRSHYPLTVPRIADSLGVNRRTLERRFLSERGHSLLVEINDCRLNRAKRLLEETDLPIKAIAHLAGFPSEQRMRATFVARVASTPSQCRARVRGA